MNRTKIIEALKNFTRNKTYQMLFALLVGGGIVYGAYAMAIKELMLNRKAIEERIATTDVKQVMESIQRLQKKRDNLVKEYQGVKVTFEGLEGKIYQEYYPIIGGILDEINRYAFNIHEYKLQKDYKKMDVTIEGSYQNLIRLLDYLGTLPATVIVSQYKITLSKEQRMLISLTIEVETIRI
jgi:Tfp pilus assembly protein PilO